MNLIRTTSLSLLVLTLGACGGQRTTPSTTAKPTPAGAPAVGRPAPAGVPQGPTAAAPAAAAPAPAGLDSVALLTALRSILDSLPAQTALHAKHLTTGREIAIRADVPMNTASVIKVPIMVLAYRDVEAGGSMILEARHLIGPDDLRRGSGLLKTFEIGLNPTWRDLITQMIITSDNTATDILIGKLGRDRVNRMLDSLGYKQTILQMTTGRLFRATWEMADTIFAGLSDREVYDKGFPTDSATPVRMAALVADPNRWLGRSTARETSRLLEQLERGELAGRRATEEMRTILRRQTYRSALPGRLSSRVPIGNKTGSWPPYLSNDVGILYAPSGPIVISAFTTDNRGRFEDLDRAMARIAELIFDAWGPAPAP